MKTNLWVVLLLLAASGAPAQTNNLTALLQQGLLEEQGNRNLDAAITDYQSLAVLFEKDRQVAATAVFRLGECYRAQGKTNEATAQYQRILREFPDQNALATMSRQNLTGLGAAAGGGAPSYSDAVRQKERHLLEEEIKVLEQRLPSQQALVKEGLVGEDAVLATREKLIELTRRLAALEGGQSVSAPVAGTTDDEDQEIERIGRMIQNSPDLINALGEGNPARTPLGNAAYKGQLRVATFLLDHGADINPTHGELPLDVAARNAQKTMVELLLSRGAEVNGSSGAALRTAAENGYQAVVEVLLAHKADVNLPDQSGKTPLCYAAQGAQVKIIQTLLAAGANPNAQTRGRETPLMFGARSGSPETVKALLAAGADSTAKSNNGMTPLTVAVRNDSVENVKLLLAAKADPNDSLLDGESLLFKTMPKPDVFGALLDAGANVEAREKNEGNRTLLIAAVQGNNVAAVVLLLKHGADPNVRSDDGNTPLHFGAITPLADRKIFESLLDHHADPNLQNNGGFTPLSFLNRLKDNKVAAGLTDLLRQHGAMENPPQWNSIEVNRLSANVPITVFQKGAKDWNEFTLLETILNYYRPVSVFGGPFQQCYGMPFPDLSHVLIVRPSHGTTNETRIAVNLLDSTNGIDCAKDVPLEFGDRVEIPPRDHSLGEQAVYLTEGQRDSMFNCLKGKVQLVAHDQKVEIPIYPTDGVSTIDAVLGQAAAQQLILASSDLSRVKVTRRDPKTGEKREWILDCRDSGGNQTPAIPGMPGYLFNRFQPPRPGQSSFQQNLAGIQGAQAPAAPPDLRLRDGDVIEVPEKP